MKPVKVEIYYERENKILTVSISHPAANGLLHSIDGDMTHITKNHMMNCC
jgi:hypothetical protein